MAQTILPTKQSKRLTRPSSALALLALMIGLGGCLPQPPVVSIDWSRVPQTQTPVAVDLPGPMRSELPGAFQTHVGGKSARILREREGESLWEHARQTLAENRRRSFEQLQSDLERRYIGEARSRAITLREENREIDDADWRSTLDAFRAELEQFADQKGPLAAELAGYIGFPDRGQRVPRRRNEEMYVEYRRDKVAELRKLIASLDAEFSKEATAMIADYQVRAEQRIAELNGINLAGDAAAKSRAERDAREAVQKLIGAFDDSLPELAQDLPPLSAESVQAPTAKVVRPEWAREAYSKGVPRARLQEYANVFVRSRGWRFAQGSAGRDVTEEFIEWLKTNGPEF